MRLINKTDWDTRQLRRLFSFCIHWIKKNKHEDYAKVRARNLTVEIVHSKCNRTEHDYIADADGNNGQMIKSKTWYPNYSGVAYLSGHYMKLRIPQKEIVEKKVANLFIHEFEHILGYHHNMMTMWEDYLKETDISQYKIGRKVLIEKPKADIQLIRYEHAKQKLSEKESLFKRLQGQLRKWRSKVRRYENVLMAAGKIK